MYKNVATRKSHSAQVYATKLRTIRNRPNMLMQKMYTSLRDRCSYKKKQAITIIVQTSKHKNALSYIIVSSV